MKTTPLILLLLTLGLFSICDNSITEKSLNGMLQSGKRSAEIYYNLSCLEYKRGDMIDAFLNNRRCALYEPLNQDNNYNLSLIQKNFIEQSNIDYSPLDILISWPSWQWLLMISIGSIFAFVFFWAIFPNRFSRLKWGLSLLSLLFLVVMGARAKMILNDHHQIVYVDRASIHSGPNIDYPILYWAHQGLLANEVGHREGWVLLRLSNGDEGWINEATLVKLKNY